MKHWKLKSHFQIYEEETDEEKVVVLLLQEKM